MVGSRKRGFCPSLQSERTRRRTGYGDFEPSRVQQGTIDQSACSPDPERVMSAVLDTTTSRQAADEARSGKLINIDNGGTLTDICVIDGDKVWRTKPLTTPYDLSKCLFEGLQKVSRLKIGRAS